MLIAEKGESDSGGEPYYRSDMSDVIEVDVAEAETVYVVLSEREYGGQPYFHHLMVERQHAAYCENLPEKHYSRRSGTIRSYMKTSNIEDNATDFFNFCKSLSEQKYMVTTAASVMPLVQANAATIEFSREVALRQLAMRPVKEQRITIGSLQ